MNSAHLHIQTTNRYSIFLCEDEEPDQRQKSSTLKKKNKKKSKRNKSEVMTINVDNQLESELETATNADNNELQENGIAVNDEDIDGDKQTSDDENGAKAVERQISWYDMCEEESLSGEEPIVEIEEKTTVPDGLNSCDEEQLVDNPIDQSISSQEWTTRIGRNINNRDRNVGHRNNTDNRSSVHSTGTTEFRQKRQRHRPEIGPQPRHFRNANNNMGQMQKPTLNGSRHHHHHEPQSVNNGQRPGGNNSAKAPIKHISRDSHVPIHHQHHQKARQNRNGCRFGAEDGNRRLGGSSWRANEPTHETNIADNSARQSVAATVIDNNWRSNKKNVKTL